MSKKKGYSMIWLTNKNKTSFDKEVYAFSKNKKKAKFESLGTARFVKINSYGLITLEFTNENGSIEIYPKIGNLLNAKLIAETLFLDAITWGEL